MINLFRQENWTSKIHHTLYASETSLIWNKVTISMVPRRGQRSVENCLVHGRSEVEQLTQIQNTEWHFRFSKSDPNHNRRTVGRQFLSNLILQARRWVVQWQTVRFLSESVQLWLPAPLPSLQQRQATLYLWALRQTRWKTLGVVWVIQEDRPCSNAGKILRKKKIISHTLNEYDQQIPS